MGTHRFLIVYRRLLKDRPILVQSVQSGIMVSMGDLIAQTVVEKKSLEALDLWRTARFFTLGSMLIGPSQTVWYRTLSKIYVDSGKIVVLKKVATDQLLFGPVLLASTVTTINLLGGHGWEFTKEQLRVKYADILLTGYKIWPAVQLINFYLVPVNYQVLLLQCVGLFWNVFLSWKTQKGL